MFERNWEFGFLFNESNAGGIEEKCLNITHKFHESIVIQLGKLSTYYEKKKNYHISLSDDTDDKSIMNIIKRYFPNSLQDKEGFFPINYEFDDDVFCIYLDASETANYMDFILRRASLILEWFFNIMGTYESLSFMENEKDYIRNFYSFNTLFDDILVNRMMRESRYVELFNLVKKEHEENKNDQMLIRMASYIRDLGYWKFSLDFLSLSKATKVNYFGCVLIDNVFSSYSNLSEEDWIFLMRRKYYHALEGGYQELADIVLNNLRGLTYNSDNVINNSRVNYDTIFALAEAERCLRLGRI